MEGFSGTGPILVKVSWLPSTSAEVPLINPVQTPEGLRADTKDATTGIITRWFAPWTSVVYIKQTLNAEESGLGKPDPPVVAIPTPPPTG